ncbi:MAG: sigma-70 family RNA polymerase sigma factor [Bacteroidales bacterium]|nr:sigma-70 family RNA polymerase sigma factor [Bacteroidales bacterium]
MKKNQSTQPIMKIYQNELKRCDILTPEEEIKLHEAFLAGDKKTRDRLATSVLRHAYAEAQKNFGGIVDEEELVSAANEGVMEALVRYRPEKGTRFITYANIWIFNKLQAAIDDQKKYNGYKDDEGNYYFAMRSLDRNFGLADSEDDTVNDHETTPSEYANELTEKMFQGLDLPYLQTCIGKLTKKERDVIKMYFGMEDMGKDTVSLEEIGDIYGLSKERVRQIRNSGIEKMARMMGGGSSLAA